MSLSATSLQQPEPRELTSIRVDPSNSQNEVPTPRLEAVSRALSAASSGSSHALSLIQVAPAQALVVSNAFKRFIDYSFFLPGKQSICIADLIEKQVVPPSIHQYGLPRLLQKILRPMDTGTLEKSIKSSTLLLPEGVPDASVLSLSSSFQATGMLGAALGLMMSVRTLCSAALQPRFQTIPDIQQDKVSLLSRIRTGVDQNLALVLLLSMNSTMIASLSTKGHSSSVTGLISNGCLMGVAIKGLYDNGLALNTLVKQSLASTENLDLIGSNPLAGLGINFLFLCGTALVFSAKQSGSVLVGVAFALAVANFVVRKLVASCQSPSRNTTHDEVLLSLDALELEVYDNIPLAQCMDAAYIRNVLAHYGISESQILGESELADLQHFIQKVRCLDSYKSMNISDFYNAIRPKINDFILRAASIRAVDDLMGTGAADDHVRAAHLIDDRMMFNVHSGCLSNADLKALICTQAIRATAAGFGLTFRQLKASKLTTEMMFYSNFELEEKNVPRLVRPEQHGFCSNVEPVQTAEFITQFKIEYQKLKHRVILGYCSTGNEAQINEILRAHNVVTPTSILEAAG